jgi:hyperosmotically inducible protein
MFCSHLGHSGPREDAVMRVSLTVPGLVAAAVLLPGALPSVALAAGPDSATNPTSRQPEDANTPTQASKKTDDIYVTQQIRDALMADRSLSAEAKQVDVRTNTDAVVLRGSVTADEKDRIEHVASQYAGIRHVTSQLTVRDFLR